MPPKEEQELLTEARRIIALLMVSTHKLPTLNGYLRLSAAFEYLDDQVLFGYEK